LTTIVTAVTVRDPANVEWLKWLKGSLRQMVKMVRM
jgi:hypothetical protein